MSSGDRAKPTSYEERNPFDISKRSGKDVAAEIAQRLAAWKQARGRSYATPPAAGREATKQAPLAAPVQPARLPKFAEPVARPQQPAHAPRPAEIDTPRRTGVPETAPARASARAPLFATASVIRRAMPPAPSPKRPAAPPEPQFQMSPVEALHAAPALDSPPPPETLPVATPDAEIPEVIAEAPEARNSDSDPTPSLGAASKIETTAVEDGGADGPASETPAERAQEFRGGDAPLIAEMLERQSREADVSNADVGATPTLDAQPIGSTVAEPSEDAALARDVADEDVLKAEANEAESPSIDASAAEKLDASAPPLADEPDESPEPMSEPITAPPEVMPAIPAIDAFDDERRATESPNIATSGFDDPVEEKQLGESATFADEPVEAPEGEGCETSGIGTAREPVGGRELVARRTDIEIVRPAALRADARDIEPRLGARRIELPSIETRIENRRIDTLRADPVIAGRRPIFPHIDEDAWEVPRPMVAQRNAQSRGGTGWAIGLGTVLLIVGITAPAAIWQGRQQAPVDQVVALVPAPEPQARAETPAISDAQIQRQPNAPAPQVAAAPPSTPSSIQAQLAPSPPAHPEVSEPAPEQQTALNAVGNGGEVARAPIIAPPPPEGSAATAPGSKPVDKSPASKTGAQVAAVQAPAFQPVAHPFIPEPGLVPTPFQSAPGSAASIPIDGAAPASIALKPSLIAQLKPKAAIVSAPRPANTAPQRTTRKPSTQNPRNLDQMFQTLIDTLSEGRQPVNPNNKPIPPSTRR